MKLSDHFTRAEFERSSLATRLGIDNRMSNSAIENATQLCQQILEPVRARFGPIRIESGHRCLALNKVVGGSSTSQHIFGQAADIEVSDPSVSNIVLAQWIADSGLGFDQLILEYPGPHPKDGWVHVSWGSRPRRMRLKKTKEGYAPW